LYQAALEALQIDDYDAARASLRKAAALAPTDVEIVEAYGALLAEVGPREEAVAVLQTAVQLSPEAGFEKYMCVTVAGRRLARVAAAAVATPF
jgi:Flp pilus assembly protein TadD